MPNIKLQSSDGEIFETDMQIAKCAGTIKSLLENLGLEDQDNQVIPLPNVDSAILRKVLQWVTHHKDDVPPFSDEDSKEKRTDDISLWDASFLDVDQSTVFEILLAANYLDIKGLIEIACKKVAHQMKGKTPEELRQMFNIENDFTPEEEEMIRKENELCHEI